jgi:hypothetical protein
VDELPPDVFVALLLEPIAAKPDTTLTLATDVKGDQLVKSPDRDSPDVVVQGNELLIGGHRVESSASTLAWPASD